MFSVLQQNHCLPRQGQPRASSWEQIPPATCRRELGGAAGQREACHQIPASGCPCPQGTAASGEGNGEGYPRSEGQPTRQQQQRGLGVGQDGATVRTWARWPPRGRHSECSGAQCPARPHDATRLLSGSDQHLYRRAYHCESLHRLYRSQRG